jgi:hypothetical protein
MPACADTDKPENLIKVSRSQGPQDGVNGWNLKPSNPSCLPAGLESLNPIFALITHALGGTTNHENALYLCGTGALACHL